MLGIIDRRRSAHRRPAGPAGFRHTARRLIGLGKAALPVLPPQPAAMPSAQDAFRDAVRSLLRPRMKALGLTGSGTTFVCPSESHFAMIGLQKSQSSDRRSVKFTANVTVVGKDGWATLRTSKPYLPVRPAPNTYYGSDVWQSRIGKLLPGAEDTWWVITKEADATAAVEELAAAIEEQIFPEIQARLGE